ncbi:hypothetical protein N9C31_01105 [Gammaproteobacteria bacterium]|nr:hypothetical protein [Gammaproteobacteria bacterium]
MKNTTAYFKEILEKAGAESVFKDMLNSIGIAIESWTVLESDALSEAAAESECDPQVKVVDVDVESGQMAVVASHPGQQEETALPHTDHQVGIIQNYQRLLLIKDTNNQAQTLRSITETVIAGKFTPQEMFNEHASVLCILQKQFDRISNPGSHHGIEKDQILKDLIMIFVHNLKEIMSNPSNQEIFKALAKMSTKDFINTGSASQQSGSLLQKLSFSQTAGKRFEGLRTGEFESVEAEIQAFCKGLSAFKTSTSEGSSYDKIFNLYDSAHALYMRLLLKQSTQLVSPYKLIQCFSDVNNELRKEQAATKVAVSGLGLVAGFFARPNQNLLDCPVLNIPEQDPQSGAHVTIVAESDSRGFQEQVLLCAADGLKAENAELKAARKEDEKVNIVLKQKITELEGALVRKEAEHANLQEVITTTKATNARLEEAVKNSEGAIGLLNQSIALKNAAQAELERDLARARQQAAKSETEKASAEERADVAESALADMMETELLSKSESAPTPLAEQSVFALRGN